jgi:hypothetical protein
VFDVVAIPDHIVFPVQLRDHQESVVGDWFTLYNCGFLFVYVDFFVILGFHFETVVEA